MKRRLTFAICILMLTLVSFGQRPFPFGGRAYPIIPYPVIPYPNKLAEETGTFKFKSSLTVTMPPEFRSELPLFTRTFADEYFTRIVPSPNGKLVFKRNAALENEEYRLTVTSEKMEVEAAGTTGCFWAIQTIRHLMILTGDGTYTVANCQIEDKPRLIWRGFMLDESRHFYGKKVVKELLDQMALIKMNVFHWHLTDDHGWRIQI